MVMTANSQDNRYSSLSPQQKYEVALFYKEDYNKKSSQGGLTDDVIKRALESDKLMLSSAKEGYFPAIKFVIEQAARFGEKAKVEEKFPWLLAQAKNGNAWSQYYLGFCYEYIDLNASQSVFWYTKAGENQIGLAYWRLYQLYYFAYNNLVNKDEKKALAYLQKSCDTGCAEAMLEMSVSYLNGELGLTTDYYKAFSYMKKSADLGVKEAQRGVGVFYLNGIGCVKNMEEAKVWLQKAADQGDKIAIQKLQSLK